MLRLKHVTGLFIQKKKPLQEPKAQSGAQNNAIGDPNSAFPAVS